MITGLRRHPGLKNVRQTFSLSRKKADTQVRLRITYYGQLRHSNLVSEIHVLNSIQQFHALTHRALESFASGD